MDEDRKRGGQVTSPSTWRKIARVMIADDPQESLKRFASGRIKPLIQRTILDTISVIITGEPLSGSWLGDIFRGSSGYTNYSNASTTYTAPPSSIPKADTQSKDPKFKGCVYFEEYSNKNDPDYIPALYRAKQVLEDMNDYLRTYKKVSIMRLYDFADISGAEYQSDNWGWTDLSGADIYPSNNGYTLHLPPYKYLS